MPARNAAIPLGVLLLNSAINFRNCLSETTVPPRPARIGAGRAQVLEIAGDDN
jgi:hypothetical protein